MIKQKDLDITQIKGTDESGKIAVGYVLRLEEPS